MPMLKAEFTTHENRHIFDLNAAIQNSILKHIPGLYILDTYIWNRTNPSKKLMFGSYPYPSNFYAQNTIEFVAVYVKEGKAIQPSKEIKEASKLSQEDNKLALLIAAKDHIYDPQRLLEVSADFFLARNKAKVAEIVDGDREP
jgi:hypothetical protein